MLIICVLDLHFQNGFACPLSDFVVTVMRLFVMRGTWLKVLESGSFGSEYYIGHLMTTDDNRIAIIATNK